MLKTKSRVLHSIAAAGASAALILSAAGPAAAIAIHTSMIDFWPGDVGPYRTGTSDVHTFDFRSICYWSIAGSPMPEYGQIQLQRNAGLLPPVSLGNKNVGCSNTAGGESWGTQTVGSSYRFQYNGAKVPGYTGLQSGPFSNSDILISY